MLRKGWGLYVVLSFLMLIFSQNAFSATAKLTNADCVKCHPKIVKENQEKGAKHKTKVGCTDCHRGHPPLKSKKEVIPKCQMCHKGKSHYTLSNCLGCHVNPHTPLVIKFSGKLIKPCLTCHPQEGQELKDFPSAHTELGCNECHTEHGRIPNCMECHEPHMKGQKFGDCLKCHTPHSPLRLTYGKDIPNAFCGACHKDIAAKLKANKTKHSRLQCVYCHKHQHGIVPTCETCHGVPHPKAMLKKFPKCTTCHVGAHELTK